MSTRDTASGNRSSRNNKNMKSEKARERRRRRAEAKRNGTWVPKTEQEKKEVAWAKPWRFKPGNTFGRLTAGKFRKPISDRYREAIEVPIPEKERKEMSLPPGATMGDAIAVAMAIRAVGGRQAVQAAAELREAIEGKATQPLDVNFVNDLPARLKKAREKLEKKT